MKKILVILILIAIYGFTPAPEKCSGIITVRLVYPFSDACGFFPLHRLPAVNFLLPGLRPS